MIPFNYGARFQDNMLSLALKDISFASKVIKYVPEEHLHSEAHRWVFERIRHRAEKNAVPSRAEMEEETRHLNKFKRRNMQTFIAKLYAKDPENTEYIKEQLADFAKRTNFADLFAHGQTLYNSGNVDSAYTYVLEAINHLHSINFNQEDSIKIGDFEKIRQAFVNQVGSLGGNIPTGIYELDKVLGGGLSKNEGELGILLAEAKTGKSIGLIHMGYIAALLGFKVAHFVLEGTPEQTMMRYQSRFTKIPYEFIKSNNLTAKEELKLELITKRFKESLELVPMSSRWDYTVLDIEAKLRDMDRSGWKPDMVIVDYGDLLKPRESNARRSDIEQRDVFRDLKAMAMSNKIAIWSATQATRPKKEDLHKKRTLVGANVSESYDKIRIADFIASLNQTAHEKKMGIMRFHCDVYRSNASSKTINLITDFSRMIFHSSVWGCADSRDFPKSLRDK